MHNLDFPFYTKTCYMKSKYRCLCLVICGLLLQLSAISQSTNTITGNVKNSASNQPVSAVSVIIKGSGEGTYTDDRGNFKIATSRKLPLTLVFSSVGFAIKEFVVASATQTIKISFDPVSALGQDVVVSATRTPQRI